MKIKHLILILAAVLSLSLLLCSCSGKKDPDGKPSQDTTTDEKVELVPHQTVKVEKPDFGFPTHSIEVSDPTIASAELYSSGNIDIVSYNPGSCEISVYDCFGHKASVEVTVADDADRSITYTVKPCTEEFIDAADFGVVKGASKAELTAGLQAAIDHAYSQGGGTVYLYPGLYEVDILHIKDNVTLEMYSGVENATEGFTTKLANMVRGGKVTVLQGTRIMNNKLNDYGRNGASNFTIRGGVLDNNNSSRTIFLFGLANNVVLENVIVKDIKNDHMIQITGCENVKIKNCIFTGFQWGGTFTREVIQIEPSTPGAHGSNPSTTPQRFDEGEFICPKNVEIDNCYFGPSDENPGPHIAIGHHGSAHEANCENFKITNCTFDSCSYAAIRFANIVNVEITGNKFIAVKKANKLCTEEDPAFIILFSYSSATTYTNVVDSRKVTKALAQEKSGSHNLNISNNEFTVEQGSDKKIITVAGTNYTPGAFYQSGVLRQDTYDSTPYTLSGYFKSTNFIGNLNFKNNKINYSGQPTFKDNIFLFNSVYGLNFENNDVKLDNGCSFTSTYEGVKGLSVKKCYTGESAETYKLTTQKCASYIQLTNADGSTVKIGANGAYTMTLIATEGGRIEITSTKDGNIIVNVIENEGYTFAGWTENNGTAFTKTGNHSITSATTLKATFKKG